MIYLDNAATTLIKPATVEMAVVNAMRTMASPGRGAHTPAMRAAEKVFECREAAADLFSVNNPEKIIFTQNATHGLNIAIKSTAKPRAKVLVSGYEHNAVTRTLAQTGANIMIAKSDVFDREAMIRSFRENIKDADAVVCTHVSNVFGFILPIYEIAEMCHINKVPLIVDASQSAGILPVDQSVLHADFIAMPGHKGLYGPQGTGILIADGKSEPLMSGGSGADSINQNMPDYMPDRLEAGTHNVCGIAGLLEGIRFIKEKGIAEIAQHEAQLSAFLAEKLNTIDRLEVFRGSEETQSGVLSVRSKTKDCEALADELNSHGICVRAGLHCAPYAHETAGTIKTGTVRFSFSVFTDTDDILRCADIMKEISK